jgi:two-component system NarL family response regulator
MVDDHRMFREALRGPMSLAPDIEWVAEASTGAEALEVLRQFHPDILVLDIGLPDMNGIEVAQRARADHPRTAIVVLSGYADRMFVEEVLKAGACAYVLKSAGAEELLRAIRAAASGQSFLCPESTAVMVKGLKVSPPAEGPLAILTRREQQILKLLAEGGRAAGIALVLGISVATVEVHRRNIKSKLGLHTTAELTRYAIREGLVAAA